MTIYWIDDDPGRKHFADALEAEFIDARVANFTDELDGLLSRNKPNLVVLDHFLRNTKTDNRMYKRGSTIAQAVKEQWPSCPVVGITANANEDKINQGTRQNYDELFHSYRFLEKRNHIKAIANGFDKISKKKQINTVGLIGLLKAPSAERSRLEASLPNELKDPSLDTSAPSIFYRWVCHLMARSGFLFDKLRAATFIGLNEAGFEKLSGEFEKARYKGVFSSEDEHYWWSNRLAELLFEKKALDAEEMSWDIGRTLDGILTEDYSRCYKCRKISPAPETVAFLDRESQERRSMHLKCTVLHPSFKRELYFEDVRMMEGE